MSRPSQPVHGATPSANYPGYVGQGKFTQPGEDQGWPTGYSVDAVEGSEPMGNHCIGACLALGTLVAVPGGIRPIESIKVGDQVLAAGTDLKWATYQVQFSAGTGPRTLNPLVVYLHCSGIQAIVTPDHLFLLSNKTLQRADRLTSADKLMSPDGLSIPIDSVVLGEFIGEIHAIATSVQKPEGNFDGHLIVTNGLVSGDYTAQLHAEEETVIRA
jgi:hypothetical protein